MSNKALTFWIIAGYAIVIFLFRSLILAYKRQLEVERLQTDIFILRQQNGQLASENQAFRGQGGL